MHLVLDTDALVKLTRCGAKERVASTFTVSVPPAVEREAVADGRTRGLADAALIGENIGAGRISVVSDLPGEPAADLLPPGGEREVYRLFMMRRRAGDAALVSDDHRFLRRLRTLGVTGLTPGAVLVLLVHVSAATPQEAAAWLAALRPLVNDEEYHLCRAALDQGRES